MTLRSRLAAAFVAVVAVPLVLTSVVVLVSAEHSAQHRTRESVLGARAVALARLETACQQAKAAVVRVAASPAASVASLTAIRVSTRVDGVLRLDSTGTVKLASFPTGVSSDATARFTSGSDCGGELVANSLGVVVARQAFTYRATSGALLTRATAVAGVSLAPFGNGPGLLPGLLTGTPSATTLVLAGEAPLGTRTGSAATGLASAFATDPSLGQVRSVGSYFAASIPLQGAGRLIVSERTSRPVGVYVALGVVALLSLALAFAAGWFLTRRTATPLATFTAAARKVATGDLTATLPEDDGTEAGEFGAVFNGVTRELRETRTDLLTSRDELRRGVARLGITLSGTHDLERILGVILETAMASVQAQAGALLLTASSGTSLYLTCARNLGGRLDGEPENWVVSATGPGAIARVAAGGLPVHGVVGEDIVLAPDEPRARTVLGLPLRSAGRITGVLCLYDRADDMPFEEHDIESVSGFINQATVAIDNVLMHQEAQRLSVTDGLTGLWNVRYARLALDREVERAQRYGHHLGVLMLDLDFFKRVNDRYGHQRGDAVLIEVATRVRDVVREIDIVSRYGGEEMLVILPETDLPGARLLSTRILESVRSKPIGGPGEEPIWMTTSIGLAVMPTHGDSARDLVRAADTALYAAKSGGRNTSRVAAPVPIRRPGPSAVPEYGGAYRGLRDQGDAEADGRPSD